MFNPKVISTKELQDRFDKINPYSKTIAPFKSVKILMLKKVIAKNICGFSDPECNLEKGSEYDMCNFAGNIHIGFYHNGSGQGTKIDPALLSNFVENVHFKFI